MNTNFAINVKQFADKNFMTLDVVKSLEGNYVDFLGITFVCFANLSSGIVHYYPIACDC